jgi:ABC-type branched-subunit amino acid transport system substrate-binding protein
MELIIEDSKSNKEEGKKAFNRIEASHHPVLCVSTTSSVSMALAPLAEENNATNGYDFIKLLAGLVDDKIVDGKLSYLR